jgi:hypothetical protein
MHPKNGISGTAMSHSHLLASPSIPAQAVEDFRRDGFAVVRGGFDAAAMVTISRWTEELATAPEVSGGPWVYHEASSLDAQQSLISRIENFSRHHAGFRHLAATLAAAAAPFLGEEAVLFKEKINFKMPGGDGFKPHQDSQAGWGDYADYFLSVMVCIDPATLENGCLELVAGYQHKGIYREWEPLTEADMAGMKFIPVPTAPGDLVFFDSFTPHQSQPNLTDHMRRIYFATYNRASAGDHFARYHADKYRSYPPDIDRIVGKEYRYRV